MGIVSETDISWDGFEQIDEDQKPYYRSSPLVPLVKKMSEDLRALEVEYNYLSSQICPEKESKYPSIEILCRTGFFKRRSSLDITNLLGYWLANLKNICTVKRFDSNPIISSIPEPKITSIISSL